MGWHSYYSDWAYIVLAEPFCEWRVYHKERYIDSCADYRNDTEGLYLLTTVALALSTMKLARKKVLLHDMKSIETLARVDVLCVDKAGTITEPDMKLKEIFLCKNSGADGTQTALTLDELKSLILDYANASVDNNATMLALKAYRRML